VSRNMKNDWWFKFEYSKWDDPSLQLCRLETQGFWLRVYIAMRKSASASLTASAEDFTRVTGCSLEEVKRSVVELAQKKVCDVTLCNASSVTRNTLVTLKSRSLARELSGKEKTRLRVRKFRSNGDVTHDVTVQSKSKKKSNNKNKKEEEATARRKPKPKEDFITELKSKSVYSHIDIQDELDKAGVWASANNREVTQRFFVNWLNRIPKPLAGRPQPGSRPEPIPEHLCGKCFDTGYVIQFEGTTPINVNCECGAENDEQVQNVRRVG
jgi:hypothetical protein